MPQAYAINYTVVVLAAIVGAIAIGILFLLNALLAPRRASPLKADPFECGIPPAPFSWSQIHIRYYVFAILFLVFDVEAVFLFPWAVVFLQSAPFVFYEMLVFIAILLFGLLYGWRKGALQWQ
ncbi:MAG: NADH-quinone oxidoreductase subunit A [Dehalococcoidia bacterium]|nr:NADH-quinone oxidoreductase subunit A [Dehalococcoidia bacterium]MDW8119091.1 NADH-quinone oxidoreductase subunit A [Chloroflexota bacterium]